jgi:hypothetical protein
MKVPLTREQKNRRARLVTRIKSWEKILATDPDPTIHSIAEGTIETLKTLLKKGDEWQPPTIA